MKCLVAKWETKDGANTLTANDLIRVNDNKPEFGSMMIVAPNQIEISDGFMNKRNRVAFIAGSIEDLEAVIAAYDLKAGTDYSVAVGPHKIVVLEDVADNVAKYITNARQETMEDCGFRAKVNPTTSEILVTQEEGKTIYWKTVLVPEGSDKKDQKLTHRSTVAGAVDAATAEFDSVPEKEGSKK